ncbi:MAG: hypothetical protein VYD87_13275 [Pseudomonadota bacterium]|nr:hypothetical protein [Pseudomonadota bacterium]
MAELASGRAIHPVVAVHLDWPGGAVRVHSNAGTLSWGGESWTGVGRFGSVSVPDEGGGLASQSAQLRLIGASDALDDYLDDPIRGRAAWIGWGLVTTRGGATLIGELNEMFAGYMDAMRDVVQAADGGLVRGVLLQAVGGPSQRARAQIHHTAEDQERAFPGDTAGRLVINAEAEGSKTTWPE